MKLPYCFLQIGTIGERQGVDEKVDLFKPFPRGGEELLDLIHPCRRRMGCSHSSGNPPSAMALRTRRSRFLGIVHGQKPEPAFCALPNGMLGDMRRDAAIVGDVED